jgi:hypothetical protein
MRVPGQKEARRSGPQWVWSGFVPVNEDEALRAAEATTPSWLPCLCAGAGLIGRHLTFVPLAGLTLGPDALQMTVTKEQVKSAPNIELHGDELSRADESALYHHYELNYTPPETESGRRLARR